MSPHALRNALLTATHLVRKKMTTTEMMPIAMNFSWLLHQDTTGQCVSRAALPR